MDPEQFKAFMDLMNKNQTLLIEQLLSAKKPDTESTENDNDANSLKNPVINISHIPPFENFDPKKEKFKYYRQRFENYLTLKNIFEDRSKCAQILLKSLGSSN